MEYLVIGFINSNREESRMGRLKIHPTLERLVSENSNIYYLDNNCRH